MMQRCLFFVCSAIAVASAATTLAAPPADLVPVEVDTVAARVAAITESAPQGGRLAAYLNCGSQRISTAEQGVQIACDAATPYPFPSQAQGVPATQPSVFYDAQRVALRLEGLDRSRQYLVEITWWDYDDGGRTQSVIAATPDGRLVRFALPGVRLPNFTSDGQLPAQRQFRLPMAYVRDGKLQLWVRCETGPNAVVSEVWVWQLD